MSTQMNDSFENGSIQNLGRHCRSDLDKDATNLPVPELYNTTNNLSVQNIEKLNFDTTDRLVKMYYAYP